MSCHLGVIQGQCSTEVYNYWHEGTGKTLNKRKGKRYDCPIPDCSKDLALGSLQSHVYAQHKLDASSLIIAEPVLLAPHLYKLSFNQQSGYSQQKVPCPLEDCCYSASTAANLQQHFFNCHYTYRLNIEEDSNVPSYCRACSILVSLHSLQRGNLGHKQCKANIQ